MSTPKTPSEGGSGGKRGHSNMEHWGYTDEVKNASRKRRRLETIEKIRNSSNPSYKVLLREIRRFLFEEWDPIGINELDGVENEYDSYASGLTHLLLSGADKYKLVDYLTTAANESMGLSTQREFHEQVVEKLLVMTVDLNP